MMFRSKIASFFLLLGVLLFSGCAALQPDSSVPFQVKFLDEYIIPAHLKVDGTLVGGLSDLDYDGKYFYEICDLPSSPRIYKMAIVLRDKKIDTIRFLKALKIHHRSKKVKALVFDSEGLAYVKSRHRFILSSEGRISAQKDPFIIELDTTGQVTAQYRIPDYYKASARGGPRNNGVFEGLTRSVDRKGIWVANELPLKMDGPTVNLYRTKSVLRFTYYNQATKKPTRQFAYRLGRLRKVPFLPFGMNGVSAILEYKPEQFLVLERAFSAGHGRHGIRARLYQVDARKATNTLALKDLHQKLGKSVQPATKRLVFDFNSIRKKLTDHIVDNLEGMALGPTLANGHQSLLIIADNNFSSFTKEMNQVLLLEIIPKNKL